MNKRSQSFIGLVLSFPVHFIDYAYWAGYVLDGCTSLWTLVTNFNSRCPPGGVRAQDYGVLSQRARADSGLVISWLSWLFLSGWAEGAYMWEQLAASLPIALVRF